MNSNPNINWIDDHEGLLLDVKEVEARALKLKNLPQRLFRYQPLNEKVLQAIQFEAIWMSRLEYLNDPYECSALFKLDKYKHDFFSNPDFQNDFQLVHRKNITDQEVRQIRESKDRYDTYTKICNSKGITIKDVNVINSEVSSIYTEGIDKLRKNLMVCSFSERNDSPVMWAHYSSNHQGICIEYNLTSEINIAVNIYPVKYSNDMFDMTPNIRNGRHNSGANRILVASIRKAMDWSYEKEWRFLFPKEDSKIVEGNYCKVAIPTAIYLGSKFREDNVWCNELFKVSSLLKIPLIKMQMHPSEFKIIQS